MKRSIIALLLILRAARAEADDAHYQDYLLGERAVGMGGAFTAIADDPSATYYNPAGLIGAKNGILAANLSVYGFQQQSLSNAFHVPASNLFQGVQNSFGSAFQQLNIVPGMSGTVYGLGNRDGTGTYRQVLALSVLVPDDTTSYSLNYLVDQNGNLSSLSQTTSDQTALVGFGYALRISPKLALGFSLNGLYRNVTETSRTISAEGTAATTPATTFFEDDVTLRLQVVDTYVQAGVMWHAWPSLTFGITIASPTLTLFSNASTDQVLVSTSGLTETLKQNLNGNTRWPAHGRVGVAYELLDRRLLLAADFSLWGFTGYQLVDSPSVQNAVPSFVNDVQREVTWNVNVGAQYKLFDKYPILGGFYTNNSSAPSIVQCNTQTQANCEPQLDNINLYGFTLGLTIPGRYTESTIGATFSIGNGETKTSTASTAEAVLLSQEQSSTQFYFNIFVGGSYRF